MPPSPTALTAPGGAPSKTGDRGGLRRGVLGAALAFLVFGFLHALVVPPYLPPDEPPHVGYVLTLRTGALPTIDTPIPRGWSERMDATVDRNVAGIGPHRRDVLAANHPPLLYGLAVAPLTVGERLGDPEHGLVLARMLSVLLASGGVVATGILAAHLVPTRPLVAVTAAWFVALLPLHAHVASHLYTDGIAVATSTGALAGSAWLLRRGWSGTALAATAALASLAAASRASGLAAAGAAAVAAVLAGAVSPGAVRRRLARALAGGAVVVGLVALTSGWFYARNVALYGDLTGAAGLMDKLDRTAPSPSLAPLGNLVTWELWTRDYFDGFADALKPFHGTVWRPLTWVVVGVLAALVIRLAAQGLVNRRRLTWRAILPWLPGLAATVVVAVSIAQFIAVGGGLHPRYSLVAVGGAATVIGWAVADLPGRRAGIPAIVLALVLGVMHGAALVGFAARAAGAERWGYGPLAAALGDVGIPPAPTLALAAGGLAAAVGLLVSGARDCGWPTADGRS